MGTCLWKFRASFIRQAAVQAAFTMSRLSLILTLALAEGFVPTTGRCRRAAPPRMALESAMTADILSASELTGNLLANKLAPALGVAATAGAASKAAAHAVLSARDATRRQQGARSYDELEALEAARLAAGSDAGAEDSEEIVPLDPVQHLALASALALNMVALYGLSFDPVADALAGRVARMPFEESSSTSAFSEQRLQINQEYEEMLRTYRAEQAQAELSQFAPCEGRVSLPVDSVVEM